MEILERGVELIWKVISAPFKLGWWIIKWVGRQFVNLYSYFCGGIDATVETVCELKGITKDQMPPKTQEVIS